MKRTLAAVLTAFAFLLSAGTAVAQATIPTPLVKKSPVDTPQRVLFIGNSLLYESGGLQTHTHRMAAAADPKLASVHAGFKSVHITSASLDQFPVDPLVTPGNLGIKEPFQLVLLAGSAKDPQRPGGPASYRRKVVEFDTAMKKFGGRTALIWLAPVVKPKWDEEMYRANGEMVVSTANEIGAFVIPIGPAFAEAYRQRPDLKLQMDYDGYHPTVAGQYLSAAVVLASVYGRSPEGNSYTYFGALDKDTAAFLQKVAADTARKFYQ